MRLSEVLDERTVSPVCISVSKMANFGSCNIPVPTLCTWDVHTSHCVRRVSATLPKASADAGHFCFHLITSLVEILKSHTPA